MYHCGTKPVLAHIANGMYGAIVVDPAKPLPKVDNEYVPGRQRVVPERRRPHEPASLDMEKARAMMPDWTTFNGYANQYVTHPLTADPGETTRFYVVAAGPDAGRPPSTSSARSSTGPGSNGDMTQPAAAGRPDRERRRPEAAASSTSRSTSRACTRSSRHAFAHVDLGQVGLLKVGNVKGSMSH